MQHSQFEWVCHLVLEILCSKGAVVFYLGDLTYYTSTQDVLRTNPTKQVQLRPAAFIWFRNLKPN